MNYSLKNWLMELEERFGKDKKNWAFKCPSCGKVSTVKEFLELGQDVNDSYQNCIGRYAKDKGCDWAAYGLFGALGKGDVITKEDGSTVEVFAMAEKEKAAHESD